MSIHCPLHTFLSALTVAAMVSLAPGSAQAQPRGQALLIDTHEASDAAPLPARARRDSAREGRINPGALRAGRVLVTLPDGRELTAVRTHEERGAQGQVTWVGEFEDAPGSLLVVTAHRGVVTGFLHYEADIYELSVGLDGRTLLFSVDESTLPDEGTPVPVAGDVSGAGAQASGGDVVMAAGDLVTQDLLVVYTPAAVSRAGSAEVLESRIISAVAAANAAYTSSLINIRLNLVGLAQTSYTETGDMTTTLSRLRGTGDGYMDDVHALRNQTGADLVSLVSNDANYCGIAYVMSSVGSGFASSAFSVVFQDCFSNQTFAHEIGHNQGNAHDRANGGSSAAPYAFGYRTCDNIAYTAGQSFRTVMAYSCSGVPRVNYFSNPNIYYNGAPMGVAYEVDPSRSADNARSMNNTASVTAGFRGAVSGSAPTAPSNLSGWASTSDTVTLSWVDQSGDETGFTLERAEGGGAFTGRATLGSNTTSFNDSGLVGGTTYTYRIRAYNSVGSSAWSASVSVQTPAAPAPPSTPAPAVVTLSGSNATASWTRSANASTYDVIRETYNSRKGNWSSSTVTVAGDATSLTQSLGSGTHRYRVRAGNVSGDSALVIAGCAACGSDGSFTIASSPKGGGKPDKR